jgi:hypothetical protein
MQIWERTALGLWQEQMTQEEWRAEAKPGREAADAPTPRRFRHRVGMWLIATGYRIGGQGDRPLPHGGESFA